MGIKQSYFALGELHPLRIAERLLHPYRLLADVQLRGRPLHISATGRATRALARCKQPLQVEMQLYFSCVVKKRVLFHQDGECGGEQVNDKLCVNFRAVEALACDPVAFASNYPERRQLTSAAAQKMHPSHLYIDYRQGRWQGSFDI